MTEAEQPEALDERMKFEAAMIALAAEISGNDGAPLIFARDRNGYTNGAMEIGWRLFQAGRASIKAEGTEQKRPRQCLHGISEPSGWRDIETAPKDSGYVLLRGRREQDVASGYWLQSAYAGNGAWIWPFVHMTPMLWTPLPPGPLQC